MGDALGRQSDVFLNNFREMPINTDRVLIANSYS
jgi:hypothetical protein